VEDGLEVALSGSGLVGVILHHFSSCVRRGLKRRG